MEVLLFCLSVLLFLLSSFSDFELVCTYDKAYPTSHNTSPLDAVAGRGSMVWFNEASIFQTFMSGFDTLKQAKAAGSDTTFDYQGYVPIFFPASDSH